MIPISTPAISSGPSTIGWRWSRYGYGPASHKSKAEVGVQIVERWVLARLRHHAFFSLAELNQCIREYRLFWKDMIALLQNHLDAAGYVN